MRLCIFASFVEQVVYLSLTVLVVSRTLLGGDGVACRLEGAHVPEGVVTKTLGQYRILRTKLREAHSVVVVVLVMMVRKKMVSPEQTDVYTPHTEIPC